MLSFVPGRLRVVAPLLRLGLLALGGAAVACTPNIGDSCSLSTDCASDGTRVCDTSEPGGYCTVLNCTGSPLGSACPDGSFCIEFNASVPGCPRNQQTPSRIGQAFCMAGCSSDSDCRSGYICRLPGLSPWDALTLDPNSDAHVCLAALWFVDGGVSPVGAGFDGSLDAIPPVCQASGPPVDAGFPPVPDAAPDANADAAKSDAGPDAGKDAGKDGGRRDAGGKDGAVKDAAPDARG